MPPTALFALDEVAFGKETNAGTIVAADTGMVVDDGAGSYAETIEREVRDAPRGVLAEVEDVITRKASGLSLVQDLTFEEFPVILLGGLKQVTGGAGPTDYTYTVLPSTVTPDTLDAFSWEATISDGTTLHYLRKFGYGQCSEFTVDLAFGQPAKVNSTWFGRAGQTLASAASPAVLTGRQIIQSELFALKIDATWAGLGGTAKSGLIRSGSLTVNTGVQPDFTLDGRSDLDLTKLTRGRITGTFELTAEFTADATTEVTAWRDGTLRFISLEAAGTANRSLKLQAAVKYVESPQISHEDELVVVTLVGRFRYDPTSGNVFNAIVVNQIAAY